MSGTSDSPPLSARLRDGIEVLNTPFRFVQDGLRFPFSERRYERRLDASLAARPEAVMVYSAPKTATTAIAHALEEVDRLTVIKVHHVQPEHDYRGAGTALASAAGALRHRAIEQRTTRRFLARRDGPIRVVSMIREPVAFNVSNFTFFGKAYWLRTAWRSAPWMSASDLGQRFLGTFPHGSSSIWWTREFAPTIGFDPLGEAFDAERGWQLRACGRFHVLLLRADLDDAVKAEALRAWMPGVELPAVQRVNENGVQAPPVLAERLREFLRGRPGYVDEMLALPASRRFWTDAQRRAIRSRWLS